MSRWIKLKGVNEKTIIKNNVFKLKAVNQEEVVFTDSWLELIELLLGIMHYEYSENYIIKLIRAGIFQSNFKIFERDNLKTDYQYIKLGLTEYYLQLPISPGDLANAILRAFETLGYKVNEVELFINKASSGKRDIEIGEIVSKENKKTTQKESNKYITFPLADCSGLDMRQFEIKEVLMLASSRKIKTNAELITFILECITAMSGSKYTEDVIRGIRDTNLIVSEKKSDSGYIPISKTDLYIKYIGSRQDTVRLAIELTKVGRVPVNMIHLSLLPIEASEE